MFIIAAEQTRELNHLRKLLDKLGQPYRVFITNLETDLDQETESLATFFTQTDPASKIGEPLFFNDLSVPELWECWTLGITTYLFDGEERRANIVLREDLLSRTVDRVEWFGQKEEIASIDFYNRYGWRSQQSLLNEGAQPYLEIYLNRQQEEVLLHFVLQGTFLHQTSKGRDQLYANKEELQRAVLKQVLPEKEAILLMNQSLLAFVKELPKERLALCRSTGADLEGIKEQVEQILVLEAAHLHEKKEGYTSLSGFVDVDQEKFQPEALVMTASQEVEGLADLVHDFPQVTFHIAALTAMGPKLTDLDPCPNVRLYPGISMENYEELLATCSLYLDCNQGEEVMNSSIRALENGQILLGLQSTVHHEAYKELTTITASVEEMKARLGALVQHPESYEELLREQVRILQLPQKEALMEIFKQLEGGKG
ncbi:accessory Sec system glycosyltransferase GtfB [Streptococcus sp. OMI633]|uniref:accessory Sec system glycosyltransferase GtfB n=1 Tax=unclassified Streptococcus TaxID=2608887 RepID=UPI0039C4276D